MITQAGQQLARAAVAPGFGAEWDRTGHRSTLGSFRAYGRHTV